jgi:hypothetical protein
MFRTALETATALSIDNVRCRQILPVLSRCAVCKKAPGKAHLKETHKYERDQTMPRWHGWHAFRRGLATDLNRAPIKVAQGALRHADPAVTMRHYAKTVDDDVRQAIEARAQVLETALENSLTDTSRTLKTASRPESVSVN